MSSPKDSRKKTGAESPTAPAGKTGLKQEHYFPEDERSPLEAEDDHSHTDFDLEAELDRKAAAKAALQAMDSAEGEHHDFADPEDVRPCYEGEGDHSFSEIDLDAEIEAKLGKAPEEAPSPPIASKPEEFSAPPEAKQESDALEDIHDPEDIRPCYEGEADHSIPAFDLDAEIEAQLKKREQEKAVYAASLQETVTAHDDHHADLHLEDERSPMDWEDDHSHADPLASNGLSAAPPDSHSPEENDGAQAMHPDLAASFAAFQTFQGAPSDGQSHEAKADGLEQEEKRGPDSPEVDDDSAPSDKPEQCTEEDCVEVEGENSDGSLSESGYLTEVTAGAAAGKLYAEDEEEPDLRDKVLPATENKPEDEPARAASEKTDEETESRETAKALADLPAKAGGPPLATGGGGGDDEDEDEDEDGAEDGDDKPMSLRDHLRELRKRLLRAFLWMIGGFLICYPFAEDLFGLLMEPLIRAMPKTSHFIFTNPPEAFFTYMKVAFVAGIFLASPMVFYQIWAFVAPGLYKEEKVYIVPVAAFSAVFFTCGGAFCYFIGLPFVFEFFMSYNTGLIQAMPSLKETLSFVLQLLLAFGLVFELPLFIFFLSRLGIVTADMMRRFRRYSVLVNVILAAILTPPDVMSQMLMAGPLIILYEISILIAAIFGKKKPQKEEESDDDADEEDEEEPKALAKKS